jgi:cob(I)alamin adenosyltransferase
MEIAKLVPKEKKGLVVVITGYGKGKTTTALGISVRACGHDMRGYASFNS